MNIGLQLLCMAVGYCVGAIPVARFVTRFASRRDVLTEGSGNAGAMNAYRVSGKLAVGIIVGILDAAKGFAAVYLGLLIGGGSSFIAPALAGFFAIMGHNYNAFQGWRGGRGLAPAAGVFLAINPIPVALFCAMWLTGYGVIRRNVHVGSMVGILGTAILLYNVPDKLVQLLMRVPCEKQSTFTILAYLTLLQLFVRHLEPIRALLNEKTNAGDTTKSE